MRQVCPAVRALASLVSELYLDAVLAHFPVQGVLDFLEVRQQTHLTCQVWQLFMGDRRKPRVFEGSYQGIALQGLPQMVLLEGPDATSQTALEIVGHEKRILVAVEISFVTCHALVGQEMLQIMKAVACEMFMHFIIHS